MNRIEINVITGKKKIIPLTESEVEDFAKGAVAEKVKRDNIVLTKLKEDAETAEMKKSINIMTGTTSEAIKYREELAK
jgi:hypothetical protein